MADRPNVLIFMTDQQRGATVTVPRCLTPNLDRFRKEGVTFTNASCPSPHCCPSRATFFSGLYPSEHGVWHNVNVTNAISREPEAGVRMWSEDFRDAGYAMPFFGKWHVSATRGASHFGWDRGAYDEYGLHVADPVDAWQGYRRQAQCDSNSARKDGWIPCPGWGDFQLYGREEDPFGDRKVVEDAARWLRSPEAKGKPWCQYVGTLGPHDPYKVPRQYLEMYDPAAIELPESFTDTMEDKPGFYRRTRDTFTRVSPDEHRQAIAHYLAFCTYEDALFGQLLRALEETGQRENTLVIYLSDHGDYLADHGLWCKGLPCFRGAYEIPLVMAWPGHVAQPGSTVEKFVTLADLSPTLLAAAGLPARVFSGQNLLPFLRGETPEGWRTAVFTQSNGNELYGIQRSVTTERWKYVYNGFDYDELYDLQADPHETKNLARVSEYEPVVRDLCARIWQFGSEHRDRCINPYIMVRFAPVGPMAAFTRNTTGTAEQE